MAEGMAARAGKRNLRTQENVSSIRRPPSSHHHTVPDRHLFLIRTPRPVAAGGICLIIKHSGCLVTAQQPLLFLRGIRRPRGRGRVIRENVHIAQRARQPDLDERIHTDGETARTEKPGGVRPQPLIIFTQHGNIQVVIPGDKAPVPHRAQQGPEIQPVLITALFKNAGHLIQKTGHGLLHNPQHSGCLGHFLGPNGRFYQFAQLGGFTFPAHLEPSARNTEKTDETLFPIRAGRKHFQAAAPDFRHPPMLSPY